MSYDELTDESYFSIYMVEWVAIISQNPILQEEPEIELVSSAEDLSRVSWVVL